MNETAELNVLRRNNAQELSVRFTYINHQGRFEICYYDAGFILVSACCIPRPGVTPGTSFEESLCTFDMTPHSLKVEEDLLTLAPAEILKRYHDDFLSNRIQDTNLEPPSEAQIPRISLKVPLYTGNDLQVIFRADGCLLIVGDVTWNEQMEQLGRRYQAPFPFPRLAHRVPSCHIEHDAGLMPESGGSARSGPGEADASKLDYEELFWSEINPTLDFPWIRHRQEIQDTKLAFRNGDLETFDSLLSDCVRVDDAVWLARSIPLALSVLTGTNGVPAHLYERDYNFSPSTEALIKSVLSWSDPTGHEVVANGQIKDNWIGWRMYSLMIGPFIEPPTASDRMEALERLVNWADHAGVQIEHYLPA